MMTARMMFRLPLFAALCVAFVFSYNIPVKGKKNALLSLNNRTPKLAPPLVGCRAPSLLMTAKIGQQDVEDDKMLKRSLEREFFTIGVPALAGLAADPLAGFVDSAFLGRLGPAALGAAGVALTAQYSFSKLYNDPLLRTTTSLVAGEAAAVQLAGGDEQAGADRLGENVSAALVLAVAIGLAQALFFLALAPRIVGNMVGTGANSVVMREPAINYLRFRSIGGPASCLLLVSQGIFRGLGDTATPLRCTLAGNALNVVLDALFIGTFGWGCAGAAAATSIGNYAAVFLLLRALRRKPGVKVRVGRRELRRLGPDLREYGRAGGLVMARSFGKVWGYAYCGRAAALLGASCMAAHNLTFQLGIATTQLVEAVAVAAQALLARELAGPDDRRAQTAGRHVVRVALAASLALAGGLSALTWVCRRPVLRALTSDAAVQGIAGDLMPIVLAAQVAKGLAYPTNGIILGGKDWTISTLAMWAASLASVGYLWNVLRLGQNSLHNIWVSLTLFFVVQVITSTARFCSGRGIWARINFLGTNHQNKFTKQNEEVAVS